MHKRRYILLAILCMGYGLLINSPQNRCRAQTQNNLHKGLVAYWKLNGDCRDYSGYRNHGINHGVKLTEQAGDFNGTGYIEVPHSDSLSLGTKDFSVAARIRCNELTDDIGDILSKFDPVRRKGFNFSVVDTQYRSPANRRNLFFGIDNGKVGPWIDCGKCDNVGVWCLCVHKGKLYAGPYIRNNGSYTDLNPQGHVYRWAGGTTWTDLGRLGDSSNVLCMASFRGELYAGVSYDRGENGLAGRVYRYDQDNERWIDCGQVGDCQKVECMAVFRGSLYVGVLGGGPDSIYRYEGGTKWTSCEKKLGGTTSLGVCLGNLYAGRAHVDRYQTGTTWTDLGRPGGEENYQIWSITAYQGRLFIGAFPSGHVYRHDGGIEWTDFGHLQTTYQDDGQKEVMSLLVYNGKLYGSVWPTGEVYRYDGNKVAWTYLGALGKQGHGTAIRFHRTSDKHGLGTGSVSWKSNREDEKPPKVRNYAGQPRLSRTPTMALYQGKLFAGTWNWEYDLPGHVYCMEAGKSVTCDYELEAGWKHLVVVKDKSGLRLYIDGEPVVSSGTFDAADYDLSNNENLKIGFGSRDYFKGKMNQVRIYSRALTDDEVRQLAAHSGD